MEMEIEDNGLRLQDVVDCSRRLMRMQEEDVHLQGAACWSLAVLYHLHAGQATSKSAGQSFVKAVFLCLDKMNVWLWLKSWHLLKVPFIPQ